VIATIQPHPISEASRTADAASARYFELAREGVWLCCNHASQDVRDANRAAKEAAYAEWRRLISEIGGGA